MKSFSYVIQDPLGIHARPAGLLVKEAKKFSSQITISNGVKSANAAQLMKIMAMGVKKGTEITVTADGEDEEAAVAALEKFLKENL